MFQIATHLIYNLFMTKIPLVNLTPQQQEILRALLDLDLKSAVDVAKEAGINRGSMIAAINGYRPISAHKLHQLLNRFGLNDRWDPDISTSHYLRVGADIEPLKRLVDAIFGSSKLYYIRPKESDFDLDDAWTGMFLFQFNTKEGQGLLLVHRDRFRSGKGVPSTNPYGALAIAPENFNGIAWADDPEIELPATIRKQLEDHFYKRSDGPNLYTLREILSMQVAVTWQDVRTAAERYEMSAEDTLTLIEQAQARK